MFKVLIKYFFMNSHPKEINYRNQFTYQTNTSKKPDNSCSLLDIFLCYCLWSSCSNCDLDCDDD